MSFNCTKTPILMIVLLLTSSAAFSANSIDFIGLEWGANDDWRPNLVLGYKSNDNENYDSSASDSKVYGWGTSISFGWDGIERFKVFKIEGSSYVQFELGAGYNISEELPMISVGAQSKRYTMDIDMLFDGGYKSHLGINTIDGY